MFSQYLVSPPLGSFSNAYHLEQSQYIINYFIILTLVYLTLICYCYSPAERMEKEAEEERMRKQRAAVERAFQDGITKARLVTRRAALGTDRNHNRLVPNTNTDKCEFFEYSLSKL